jgi:hypothetical protein
MRFWPPLERLWEKWATAPTPLKVLYFVLACGLALGLAAAIARLESGSDGEREVTDFIDGLITVISIVGAPVLLMGLAISRIAITAGVETPPEPILGPDRVCGHFGEK